MPQAVGDSPPLELFIGDVKSSTAGIASDYIAANPPKLIPLLLATTLITDPSRSEGFFSTGDPVRWFIFEVHITNSQLSRISPMDRPTNLVPPIARRDQAQAI